MYNVLLQYSQSDFLAYPFIFHDFPLLATSYARTHELAAQIDGIADFSIRPRTFRITQAPAVSQIGKQSPP
jgi:hypothetical protein